MHQNKSPLILSLLLLFVFSPLNAQKLWHDFQYESYNSFHPEVYQKKHIPTKYKLVSLELNQLNQHLKPGVKGTILELPNENGVLAKFRIRETSNFEPALQAKFPDIRSYTAQGIDDPTAIAKLSIGTDGFHATVFSGSESTLYIDPYKKTNSQYIVYRRIDLPTEDRDFQCLVEADVKATANDMALRVNADDGKLRTYRMALVCSGEYAQFHLNNQSIDAGATDAEKKAAVLSAMNTTMTRVNGVFEIDLGVKMVLVSNNDEIIYLDATNDGVTTNNPGGITDGNAGTMINQVQDICDDVIGSENYDIGHIFSVGGAGLAGLGVVCIPGQKARGVTGIASPIGDPYDIDYVAHEIGHQFGANHTQNNNCNRNSLTAIEVGSGSTIMGYAGICSPNVIGAGSATGNSDDYFHTVSISEMWSVITSTGTCATETNTGNTAPTANAGDDYTIPKSTPFKLTGSATDADGTTSLTYNWEQIDPEVGATMPPAATNSEGPMFRSLPSKTAPTRYFPELATVIGGTVANTWEVVPSVARDLNFAFTVRDNFSGGGNTARDNMKVTIVDATPFTIIEPSTAVTWDVGTTQQIVWNVGTTTALPINCQTVNILLSTDGGATFPITLASNISNDGAENIVIPDHPTGTARIMVEAADNIFYAVNSSNFTINSTTPTYVLTNTSGAQSVCNVGNDTASYTLNLDFVNGFSENVSFGTTGLPSGATASFSPTSIAADGNVTMTISNLNGAAASNYTVTVNATSNSVNKDLEVGLQVFEGSFNALTLTAPADGDTDVALAPRLEWNADSNANAYDVEVATDSGFTNVVSSGTVSTNSYDVSTLQETTTYFWRVKPKNDCGEGSFSTAYSFTTQSCTICASSGNMEYNTSTTLVKFNTIENTTGKTVAYNDFTSISTTVKRGESHELTVNVNTDGNYRVQTKVWIDWNGDCTFNDSDEEYDLGGAGNVADGATDLSPLSITIPADAKLGNTIMRVSSRYTSPSPITYPTACMDGFDGEVEDYTIVVDEVASIDDSSFTGFNLYPNPNAGAFTLQFETIDTRKTTLELYDVRGRRVHQQSFTNTPQFFKEQIEFPEVSKGLYLLKIKNGTTFTTRKLVIE